MSGKGLADTLRDASASGSYRVTADSPIIAAARASGMTTARISLAGVRAKPELLRRFAEALGFPDWFGANWDALEDCLTDLSWRPAEGYLVIIESVAALEDLEPEDRGMLLDILQAAARFWSGQDTPFFTVFVDPSRSLALPDLNAGRAP